MDIYDFWVLIGVFVVGCTISTFFLPYKIGFFFGGVGFVAIVAQFIYVVSFSSLSFPLSFEGMSNLPLSPARLGFALGLVVAVIPHILKRFVRQIQNRPEK